MTLQEDLAQAERGVNVLFCNLLLMFPDDHGRYRYQFGSVGILLISSLLIIPAATARQLAVILVFLFFNFNN